MKQKKMKKNKGISLIVLIITIVVIIILAAAIILNLSKTNIIEHANEAVVKQDFKTFESELDLYISDKYVDEKGKLDVTTIDATTKEDVVKIIPSIKGSKYEDYVTIVDGKIAIFDTMPEEEKQWINEVIDLEIATPVIQAGTEVTTVNSSITGKSFSSTNPVIPVGFKTSSTGASWIVKDGIVEGWNDGLVIEDESGNEFVWVPCTLDDANGSIKYVKWCTNGKAYNDSNISDDVDALPNGITDEKLQISTYGGFYIGRYEAGVPGKTGTPSDSDGTPVVQRGATVWTNISYNKAMLNAKSFINTANVKSGLLTGTAWDTVCAWIQSETDFDGNILHSVTNSTSWGNHNDSISPANVTGYGSKQVTGFSENWKAKNIYDFAGNNWEWIGESYDSSIRINRGGDYGHSGSSFPASYRIDDSAFYTFDNTSFRIQLYVM